MCLTLASMSDEAEQVRRFNRFYTRLIGALDEGHLASRYSLAQVRTLYEIANRDAPTARDLGRDLGLDAGYLSRILKGFASEKLIKRVGSSTDARQSHIELTVAGRRLFDDLSKRARLAIDTLLDPLDPQSRSDVVSAMQVIETKLGAASNKAPVILRPHRIGDMGMITARQAMVYAEEYGWNDGYEALVAKVTADFIEGFTPGKEYCWIAERNGLMLGSVFVVRHRERPGVARLRLLYVEKAARGLGVGRKLVQECTRFARDAGYHTMTLWTQSILASAHRIYEAEGYALVDEQPNRMFGKDLLSQTWELDLKTWSARSA